MVRNRCIRKPRFDVIYNNAFCPDCNINNGVCENQDPSEHLDGFVHCKKGGEVK